MYNREIYEKHNINDSTEYVLRYRFILSISLQEINICIYKDFKYCLKQ